MARVSTFTHTNTNQPTNQPTAGTCILPVPTERLTRTPYWEILVEKLELDAATKAELMAGKNVGSLKVVCGCVVWGSGG